MDIYQVFTVHNRAWSSREIVCFSAVFGLCALTAFFLVRCRRIAVSQAVAGLVLLLFLGMVFASTVFTRMPTRQRYELQLFWSWREVFLNHDRGLLEENLLNCVLLLPMGMLLPFLFRRRVKMWQAFLYGFAVSAAIETCQLIFRRGLFEWDDMVHNGIGCMLGCLLINTARLFRAIAAHYDKKKESD